MNNDFEASWYNFFNWFAPQTFAQFTWEKPYFLYLILLLPTLYIFRWLLHFRYRQKLEIALTEQNVTSSPWAIMRHFLSVLMILFVSLVLLALARPQLTNEKIERWTEGIDIVLAMDISESMQIQDLRPNRLEAAKKMAENFVKGRFQDRIGIVIFAGDAYSLSPLTTDYVLLNSYIDSVDFSMIETRGTAIGNALAVSTNRMRESQAKSKVVILLSDGENTAGSIDPIMAAGLAAEAHNIKLYTIGIGREGRVPYGTDPFGNPQFIENSMDESTLREIARIGYGKYFRAEDNKGLAEIFATIDKYEKAEIKETRYKDVKDFYQIYLTWAIVFFLFWLLLKSSFLANALED